MLIEIHMIQNHSPANLNRDDLGAPKTCIFGGVTRARISSQCIKRSIRNPGNPEDIHNREPGSFAKAMKGHIGCRTKLFPWLVGQVLAKPDVKERFIKGGTTDQDYEGIRKGIEAACKVIAKKEGNESDRDQKKTREDDRPRTPQLIFLGPGHARMFVDVLLNTQEENREHFEYFLDPVTIFKAVLEQELDATSLLDEQRERVLNGGWRIKNTPQRLEELRQVLASRPGGSEIDGLDSEAVGRDDDAAKPDQSDEEVARFIARALDKLAAENAKSFESVTSSRGRKGEPKLAMKREKPPTNYKALLDSLAAIHSGDAVDIALFGRMTTSEAFADVEAAMQVAHAISTHAVVNEVDYFTAVDDLGKAGGGAAHVDEAMFNSPCFYKYFSLDWEQLVRNLAGPEPDEKKDAESHSKWKDEVKPKAEQLVVSPRNS